MSDYRQTLKDIDREVPFTVWKVSKWLVLAAVVLVPLGWILHSTGIISMNIQREIVQHSQQYTETKVSLLHKLHTDWLTLASDVADLKMANAPESVIEAKRALQKNIINRMKEEAARIPQSQIPEAIQRFLATR